jgi:ankyrin repeat protein
MKRSAPLPFLALSVVATLILSIVPLTQADDIWAAIRDDSASRVAAALDSDSAVLNTRGPGGQTPLMNAVLSGKVESVKVLIARGADASIGEKDGYTPMHGAGFQVTARGNGAIL